MKLPPAWRFVLLFPLCLAAGCGDASDVGQTWPVSGKITVDDEPFTAQSTILVFKPDASKGNSSPFEPTGSVDAEGVYTLKTKSKKGAPPGWYKVVVTAREEAATVHPKSPKHRPTSKSLVHARYGQEKTTPLRVEVVEKPEPGAYDLKLKH